jgi:hypothetical protein
MSVAFDVLRVVQGFSGPGVKERMPVATVALENYNLSTNLIGTVISGVTLAADDRVLFTGQNTPSENGIYVIDTPNYRAPDHDISENLNYIVFAVTSGTYSQTIWRAISNTQFMMENNLIGLGHPYRENSTIKYYRQCISWVSQNVIVPNDEYVTIAHFSYKFGLYPPTATMVVDNIGDLNVQIQPMNIYANFVGGINTWTFDMPTADASVTLSVRRNTPPQIPVICGIQLNF